ncbi:MAG TPA: nucleotide exchange factor GrpE [Steroidobacteraceae bacterium]|nr:nucleotide exchange factor GrpE [Steroidobacteraceae bacterium]HXP26328.1 nucleotide exchange factor GrpE [Steroidobacteraceae bacterium]
MNDNNPSPSADMPDAGPAAANGAGAALAAAEAKATENWNSYLRAVAEMENYRKRMDRELENARKYAIERFAQELVSVADSLEAGINAGTASSGSALLEGSTATLKQLLRAFDKAGIKVIDPLGQPFDPAWHEAMVAQESRDQPANTVLSVIQKGYSLNGRLLRPARVIVSKEPGGDAN